LQELSRNDIATKLTRQLLSEQFPKIDSQALDDVFYAHDCKYKETIDAIMASFGENSSIITVLAPEAIARHEQLLLERARNENMKVASRTII
jgi:hypothetical protein